MITDTEINCNGSTEYEIEVHMGIYKAEYDAQPYEAEITEMSETVEVDTCDITYQVK